MLCDRNTNDPLLKALLDKGLQFILPPNDLVQPGALMLWEKGDVIRLGEWLPIFGYEPEFKTATTGVEEEHFSASANLDREIAGSFLGRLFGREEAKSQLTAAASAAGATSVQLDLVSPSYRSLKNLDTILAEMNDRQLEIPERLKERKFFIVTRSWRARGFSLHLGGERSKSIELSADALDDISASIGLKSEQDEAGDHMFLSRYSRVFGATMREIQFTPEGIIDVAQSKPHDVRDARRTEELFSKVSDEIFFKLEAEEY